MCGKGFFADADRRRGLDLESALPWCSGSLFRRLPALFNPFASNCPNDTKLYKYTYLPHFFFPRPHIRTKVAALGPGEVA